jgi:hypothetical protein
MIFGLIISPEFIQIGYGGDEFLFLFFFANPFYSSLALALYILMSYCPYCQQEIA